VSQIQPHYDQCTADALSLDTVAVLSSRFTGFALPGFALGFSWVLETEPINAAEGISNRVLFLVGNEIASYLGMAVMTAPLRLHPYL
jgi:hypothetical protein